LRDLSGKSARIKERLKIRTSDSEFEVIPEVELPAVPEDEAPKAEAAPEDEAPKAEAAPEDEAPKAEAAPEAEEQKKSDN
jgi:large subunit ribosomal protein L19